MLHLLEENRNHVCGFCNLTFRTNVELEEHDAAFHCCLTCDFYGPHQTLLEHRNTGCLQRGGALLAEGNACPAILPIHPFVERVAFLGYVRTYTFDCIETPYRSLTTLLSAMQTPIENIVNNSIDEIGFIKCQLNVHVVFRRHKQGQETEENDKVMNSKQKIILNRTFFQTFYEKTCQHLEKLVDIFEVAGSGWIFDRAIKMDIRIGRYRPFYGGCYINTPKYISNKKSIINIKSNDNKCFMYSILATRHAPTHRGGTSQPFAYKTYINNYDFNCISYPVGHKEIAKWEKVNNIPVNVFSYTKKEGFSPEYISEHNYEPGYKTASNLLLIEDSGRSHYLAIKDINSALKASNHHKKLLCFNCLNVVFKTKFDTHLKECLENKFQKLVMPKPEKADTKFSQISAQQRCSFTVYADMECILEKSNIPQKDNAAFTINVNDSKSEYFNNAKLGKSSKQAEYLDLAVNSKTENIATHIPCGFGYVVIDEDGDVFRKDVYRGEDCVSKFLEVMTNLAHEIMTIYGICVPLKMTYNEEKDFSNSTECYICGIAFKKDEQRCRDHSHVTGKYRGALHRSCNLNLKVKKFLPIVMHNFKSYDSHLIIHGFEKFGNDIKIIPTNSEKYLAIHMDSMRFIDSYQFLAESLEALVDTLKKKNMRQSFSVMYDLFGNDANMLLRKNVYPYEWVDSWDKFKVTKFPSIDQFHNALKDEKVKKEDYEHGQSVYKHINMKNFGQYHDIYLLSDCGLLACVFEEFRRMIFSYFKLDPVYFYSAPGLSFEAALRYTRVTLEGITDLEKYLFLEKSIRGGTSMICKRFASARNKEIYKSMTGKEGTYIAYFDAVNLYGFVMSTFLMPHRNFKFLSPKEINNFKLDSYTPMGKLGCILEVTLKYPKHLHEKHNDLPLAVDHLVIKKERLSEYQYTLMNSLNLNFLKNQKKLVPHFFVHHKYVLHIQNLQYYISKGLEIVEIHRILQFEQTNWLAPFINFCTEQRKKAETDFEKSMWKLMVNSFFGKTMENKRGRVSVKLIRDNCLDSIDEVKKILAKPGMCLHKEITKNLHLFHTHNNTVKLDKPIYIGASILDLSKLHMYKFHYDHMKVWFKNIELLFTDTDSLCYQIKTKDLYTELIKHKEHFDFSDYPITSPLFSTVNKKVLGKFTDEAKGEILTEFIGLGSKAYYVLSQNDTIKKSASKGVIGPIRRKRLEHSFFKTMLGCQQKLVFRAKAIRSKGHKISTTQFIKSALHGLDTKRFILHDGVHTLAWGHYKIKKTK